jgi:hypothetical protein
MSVHHIHGPHDVDLRAACSGDRIHARRCHGIGTQGYGARGARSQIACVTITISVHMIPKRVPYDHHLRASP